MSGTRPQCTSRTDSCVSGWTMRMSAPRAICRPPPRAWPCTAAITGTGSSCHTQQTCWPRWVMPPGVIAPGLPSPPTGRSSPPAIAANDEKSRPAQNDAPSPDSTTARTPGSDFSRSPASAIAGEHRAVEGVALVGAVEADVGDAVRVDADAVGIGRTSPMRQRSESRPVACAGTQCRFTGMKLNLSADEVLTTTRSVRKRLDFDTPGRAGVVEECLEIALQAPTGSNRRAGTGWSSRTPPRSGRSRRLPRELRRVPRRCPAPSTPRATAAASASRKVARLGDVPRRQLPPQSRCC